MAASFIPALVIKRNNDVYLEDDLVSYGAVQTIPTPGAGGDPTDGDFWAVPITDNVVNGFNFIPTTPDSTDAPTAQSFHVFRLITVPGRAQANTWYVVGTTTDYIESSAAAECCDAPVPMPMDVPALAPTQLMCVWNNTTDQDYFATWGVPTTPPGGRLYANGYFNDEALPSLSAFGYATPALLVAAMQSAWGATVGGTFTLSGSRITLTQTAGPGTDVIAINIFGTNTSSNPF